MKTPKTTKENLKVDMFRCTCTACVQEPFYANIVRGHTCELLNILQDATWWKVFQTDGTIRYCDPSGDTDIAEDTDCKEIIINYCPMCGFKFTD